VPEFGDILKYGPDQDPNDHYLWRFMFICLDNRFDTWQTLVLAIEPDDDLWVPGETIIFAGINELIPE
jgi:hypothetical protein